MTDGLVIRRATVDDTPAILALLRELATYEHLLERVRIDDELTGQVLSAQVLSVDGGITL